MYKPHRQILYEDSAMPILVLSAGLCKDYIGDRPYILISIHDPSDNPIQFTYDNQRLGSIVLSFRDAEDGDYIISDDQAKLIVDFVEKYKDYSKLLVVSCEMGLSRSPAVGAAISKAINGDDMLFYKFYTPNSVVYRKILNVMMADKYEI